MNIFAGFSNGSMVMETRRRRGADDVSYLVLVRL